ncbi:MAG: hypothetical protein LIP16_11015 [Clostridium sp.]|nr:hypothetical protein [Clostridium sp.]
MSERTLLKKVNDLKALAAQKKAIEKQMTDIQEDIKKELQARGQEETEIGDWVVRFRAVISNKFNAKSFAANHLKLYQKYMSQSQTMRFTVQ